MTTDSFFAFEDGSETTDDLFSLPLDMGDPHTTSPDQGTLPPKKQKRHLSDSVTASAAAAAAALRSKRHHCPFPSCGKEFSTSGHLARHHRIHTGEKNYACSECGVRFSRQDNCNQHVKSHAKGAKRVAGADPVTQTGGGVVGRRMVSGTASMASTESLHEDHRPSGPTHSTSYAGSLVTLSEADYASSSNGLFDDLSPTLTQGTQLEFVPSQHLPDSFYDFVTAAVQDGPPSLVYDSSATDESANTLSFINNSDFISQEDFFHWSAGVMFPDAETDSIEGGHFAVEEI